MPRLSRRACNGPDLVMRRGFVRCYLDHDGAGAMTSMRTTYCSRRNWPMRARFWLLTHNGSDVLKPGKHCQSLSVFNSLRTTIADSRIFPNFPWENSARMRQKVGFPDCAARLLTVTDSKQLRRVVQRAQRQLHAALRRWRRGGAMTRLSSHRFEAD